VRAADGEQGDEWSQPIGRPHDHGYVFDDRDLAVGHVEHEYVVERLDGVVEAAENAEHPSPAEDLGGHGRRGAHRSRHRDLVGDLDAAAHRLGCREVADADRPGHRDRVVSRVGHEDLLDLFDGGGHTGVAHDRPHNQAGRHQHRLLVSGHHSHLTFRADPDPSPAIASISIVDMPSPLLAASNCPPTERARYRLPCRSIRVAGIRRQHDPDVAKKAWPLDSLASGWRLTPALAPNLGDQLITSRRTWRTVSAS
jgi:hypothetical protein